VYSAVPHSSHCHSSNGRTTAENLDMNMKNPLSCISFYPWCFSSLFIATRLSKNVKKTTITASLPEL